jgi:hypothetical protein
MISQACDIALAPIKDHQYAVITAIGLFQHKKYSPIGILEE